MSVTIRDIARRVNLSHTTVSRVLNRRDAISIPDTTRARVLDAARELGYRPNLSARALVTGRTQLVALQLFRLDAPFAMAVARHLQALAWVDGYEVLVHEFLGSDANLRSVVDGVFLLDRIVISPDDAPRPSDPTPHVALGTFAAETIDSVAVDLETPGRAALSLFLDRGCRRIAYVGRRDPRIESLDGRVVAYREAIRAAALPLLEIDAPRNTRACGHDALLAHAGVHGFPDALFCENDELAVGCYRALRDAGRSVPADTAVIGCDGIDEAAYMDPPLTTIIQPIDSLCRLGWTFMKNRLAQPSLPRQHTLLHAQLELRASHPNPGRTLQP